MKLPKIPKISGVFRNMPVIQPILTLVLIGLLVALLFQFFGGNQSLGGSEYREITKNLSFEEAARNFSNGAFEVYTQGVLVTKSDRGSAAPGGANAQPTPTPSTVSISAVQNSYDDIFFFISNNEVKRIDIRTYGQNESIFYNDNKEIVNLSNTAKAYTVYPIPPENDQAARLAYQAYSNVMQSYFPLMPLLKDYKEGKFTPVLRSTNLYSGKWKHYLYTSDEVVDVIIQTEPETGLFRNFLVANGFTTTPSQIYFDFKKYDTATSLTSIPADYKRLEPVKPAK